MQIEGKSALIVLSTLLLGVVIGLVGHGALDRRQGFRDPPPPPPRGFVDHMESFLELRADQLASVRPLLEAAADANQRVIDSARVQLRAVLDTMAQRAAPYLDADQRERLAERAQRLPTLRQPPPRDRRGPPPREGPRRGPPRPRADREP
jgi:hypothetical protein